MPAAPIPPPFERLGNRRFAMHPPIRNIKSNEWIYRYATWSDVLIRNTATGDSISVPRRFFGMLTGTDYPVAIVALGQELEYREGLVWPYRRQVLVMPARGPDSPKSPKQSGGPAPVIGIRLETHTDFRASRLLLGSVAISVMGCLAVVGYSLQGQIRPHALVNSLSRTYLVLTAADDLSSVVRALGRPAGESWRQTEGHRLQILDYSDSGFRAVLMSEYGGAPHYIGALDLEDRVLQSVLLQDGSPSTPILQQLGAF